MQFYDFGYAAFPQIDSVEGALCLHCLASRYYISLPSFNRRYIANTYQYILCTSCAYKTYFKAELDVETAVRGTTVLGAKAVTADVAHTAASARVNFMIVV